MLKFFDCNVSIGRWKHPRPGGFETATELSNVLDYLQVERAIVYQAQAQETHAPYGNALLLDEIRGSDRLLPSWIIFPHHTGEMPEPDVLINQMLMRGVRVARMLPGTKGGHRFSLEPWSAGPLLEELEHHRLPTLIDFMFFRRDDPDWKLLYDLCLHYPRLPLIMTGWSGLASRSFFALCKVCPNLYLETSNYSLYRGLEAFCQKVGPKQLIYGSGMPKVAPGVPMTTVTYAFIPDKEKALIASGNLERLLDEVVL